MDSTLYRQLDTVAMIVGPQNQLARRCREQLEGVRIRVEHVATVTEACQQMASAMPQLLVVLGAIPEADRAPLTDRTVAVGAMTVQIDPDIDVETLETLLGRAAETAIERSLEREVPATIREEPPI